jgi:hypothetical protein
MKGYARFAWCMAIVGLCCVGAVLFLVLEQLITWGTL